MYFPRVLKTIFVTAFALSFFSVVHGNFYSCQLVRKKNYLCNNCLNFTKIIKMKNWEIRFCPASEAEGHLISIILISIHLKSLMYWKVIAWSCIFTALFYIQSFHMSWQRHPQNTILIKINQKAQYNLEKIGHTILRVLSIVLFLYTIFLFGNIVGRNHISPVHKTFIVNF